MHGSGEKLARTDILDRAFVTHELEFLEPTSQISLVIQMQVSSYLLLQRDCQLRRASSRSLINVVECVEFISHFLCSGPGYPVTTGDCEYEVRDSV